MTRLVFALLLAYSASAADYDIVIRNARVVDGSGNPWFRADVAMANGRIARIGRLSDANARRTIDAAGRVLAPGFIDVHMHAEGGIERIPEAGNLLRDGVTSIVTGNCGSSQLNIAAFFQRLEKNGAGINVATLIGHNSVRAKAMGSGNREPTAEELEAMRQLVVAGMRDGAVGFSTGLEYVPGAYSRTEEIVELDKSAASFGGVYATHMRSEGDRVLDSIQESARIGREAGMRVQISHLKQDRRRLWGASGEMIALLEKLRGEGVEITADQYPYERSSTTLGLMLPSWSRAGGADALRERLATAETRAKIKAEMLEMLRNRGQPDYAFARVARFRDDPSLEGKTIAEIAASEDIDRQIETILGLMERGDAGMVYHSMSDEDVERILRYRNVAVASDGGVIEFGAASPHPRSYGTRARVLAEFVRKRKVLSLEEAIRRMTSLPASVFDFHDRGLVREGFAADVVLFDPARVQDKATFDKPHQYSEGFDFVLVNGVIAVENGELTGARAGKPLRREVRP